MSQPTPEPEPLDPAQIRAAMVHKQKTNERDAADLPGVVEPGDRFEYSLKRLVVQLRAVSYP